MLDYFKTLEHDISEIKSDIEQVFNSLKNINDRKIVLNELSFKKESENAKRIIEKLKLN